MNSITYFKLSVQVSAAGQLILVDRREEQITRQALTVTALQEIWPRNYRNSPILTDRDAAENKSRPEFQSSFETGFFSSEKLVT